MSFSITPYDPGSSGFGYNNGGFNGMNTMMGGMNGFNSLGGGFGGGGMYF